MWSTPESVQQRELSLLAIVETLCAMAAYVWIGVRFGTWWHVWTAAAIAPFMLLRTDDSISRGWRYFVYLRGTLAIWPKTTLGVTFVGIVALSSLVGLSSEGWLMTSVFILLGVNALPLGMCAPALIGRFAGAITGLIQYPRESLAAIPSNWLQLVGCVDFRQSPELIPRPRGQTEPLVETKTDSILVERFVSSTNAWEAIELAWASIREVRTKGKRKRVRFLIAAFFVTATILPFVIPAIIFRLSIKSTAIVWLPLLWATKLPKPANEPWSAHLKLMIAGDLPRLVTLWSFLYLLLVGLKVLMYIGEHRLAMAADSWHDWLGGRLGAFAVALVRPGEIPIWQLASTVNAILAITLFLLLRDWLRRGEVGLANNEVTIERTVWSFFFVRRLLTTYTIGNQLVVFFLLARQMPLPTIGTTLFPWL